MAIWCSICNVRGHATTDCWYKPKYIKEIRKENGKLKKKYSITTQQNKRSNFDRNTKNRSRSRTPTPTRVETRRCRDTKPEETTTKTKNTRKSPPKSPSHKAKYVEIIEVTRLSAKPSTSTSKKCQECLKWNNRIAQSLHYQEMTRNEDKRIIKSLTEENQKLREEKDCYKRLLEISQQSNKK